MAWAYLFLLASTLLCSLVAGFLFAFTVAVMPGLRELDDNAFVRTFQEIDGVIQRGHPLFGLVWLGSVLALALGIAFGIGQVAGPDRWLLVAAGAAYFLGVQLPTMAVNIPLNNEIQSVGADGADDSTWASARGRFEARWNRWNRIRTAFAVVASVLLSIVILRL